jgi:hypothetical protein
MMRLIRHTDMYGIGVGIGENRDGSDTKLTTRPHHPYRNLTSVSNKYFLNHSLIEYQSRSHIASESDFKPGSGRRIGFWTRLDKETALFA